MKTNTSEKRQLHSLEKTPTSTIDRKGDEQELGQRGSLAVESATADEDSRQEGDVTSPPKPAEWKSLPVEKAWCPEEVLKHMPELGTFSYTDQFHKRADVRHGWRIVGASSRGRMHAHEGHHREDCFAFSSGTNFTALAVSDGAGSYGHARIGSFLAASRFVHHIQHELEKEEVRGAGNDSLLNELLRQNMSKCIIKARDDIFDLAFKSGLSTREFRCTLLTCLHFTHRNQDLLLWNQIGDGGICLLKKDGSTERLGKADSGDFSGEVSCFVPDECSVHQANEIHVLPTLENVEAILLCSDGIEDPFYPLEKNAVHMFRQWYNGVQETITGFKHQPKQDRILRDQDPARALAEWLQFEKRGENDDRTVLLMLRNPPGISFK